MTAIRKDFGGEQFDIGGSKVTGDDLLNVSTTASKVVNVTASTLTVTAASHANKIITLNRAAGIAVTLPAATGTGNIYTFIVATTITSNTTTIKAASASDSFIGQAFLGQDSADTVVEFDASAGTDDTVTLNGSTTGGIIGNRIEVIDIASGSFHVHIVGTATGTEATPFSATVS